MDNTFPPAPTPVPQGFLNGEPVRVAGILTNLLLSVLTLGAAFGLDISDDQRAALLGSIVPVVVAVQFLFEMARAKVTPVGTAMNRIDQAYSVTPEPGGANKPTL